MVSVSRVVGVALITGLLAGVAAAQSPAIDINQRTIGLLAGEAGLMQQAIAISRTVRHEQGLKILTLQDGGCVESVADLMQLSQVDVALVTSDCVSYVAGQGLVPDVATRISYLTRVKQVPLLIVTRRENATLTSLAGKRVVTGPADSASFASGELLLGGIGLPFKRVARNATEGIQMLKQGVADAVLLQGTDDLDGSLDPSQFHVLGLTATLDGPNTYSPALMAPETLKGLAQADVETVSTSLVLAVVAGSKQSPKATKLARFAKAYFAQQAMTEEAPELSATVAGWQRHDVGKQALEMLDELINENATPTQQGDGI